MESNNWQLEREWKNKRQGSVWIVKNQYGNHGYFKFAEKEQWYYSGPFIANELISARLAAKLGFPCAQLEEAVVAGQDGALHKGIVSIEMPAKEVITWHEADKSVRRYPERHVQQIHLLSQLVVFDAWIANVDRAVGKNLVLYRNQSTEKYNWYLIDHGLTLYGAPVKWKRGKYDEPIWQKIWRYYHVPNGLLRLQSSFKKLEPMIQKIEQLQKSDIDAVLDEISDEHLQKNERKFTRRLLLYRQKLLRAMIKSWIQYDGKKQYIQR